jgi:hypothetical protein
MVPTHREVLNVWEQTARDAERDLDLPEPHIVAFPSSQGGGRVAAVAYPHDDEWRMFSMAVAHVLPDIADDCDWMGYVAPAYILSTDDPTGYTPTSLPERFAEGDEAVSQVAMVVICTSDTMTAVFYRMPLLEADEDEPYTPAYGPGTIAILAAWEAVQEHLAHR